MRGHLPLEGLRVLDLASFIAGPVATTVMGDYGAEVIKIEPPGEGDPQRKLGQAHSVPQHPVNFCWHMTNRNKRAIVLDLKHPEGRSVFERLLKTADVMVVNFPLKVRTRLRMRYEDVAPINPRLIYGSMTGYGESGPDAEQPGFDLGHHPVQHPGSAVDPAAGFLGWAGDASLGDHHGDECLVAHAGLRREMDPPPQ